MHASEILRNTEQKDNRLNTTKFKGLTMSVTVETLENLERKVVLSLPWSKNQRRKLRKN